MLIPGECSAHSPSTLQQDHPFGEVGTDGFRFDQRAWATMRNFQWVATGILEGRKTWVMESLSDSSEQQGSSLQSHSGRQTWNFS